MELPHLDFIHGDESGENYDIDVARTPVISCLTTQSVCGEQAEVLHLHDSTPGLPDRGAECRASHSGLGWRAAIRRQEPIDDGVTINRMPSSLTTSTSTSTSTSPSSSVCWRTGESLNHSQAISQSGGLVHLP